MQQLSSTLDMDAYTTGVTLVLWTLFTIIFGPMIFFICIYLPEIPVRYIKGLRGSHDYYYTQDYFD